jgi:hypothetical protein
VTINSLNGGTEYYFRVRAHNIHGWGAWSDILQEVASGIPAQPAPVEVHIVNLDVKISWTAPNMNFATITAYEISIL